MKTMYVVIILLLVGLFTAYSLLYVVPGQVVQPTSSAMTATHGKEVSSIIESFELTSGSLDSKRDPNTLSSIMAGEYLQRRLSLGIPDAFYITTNIYLKEIRILEYTPSQIKAIGCGVMDRNEVTVANEYIRSLDGGFFQRIYVFSNADGMWKLIAMYDFTDNDGAIRDWAYTPNWEKELIGELPDYIHEHFNCGINM